MTPRSRFLVPAVLMGVAASGGGELVEGQQAGPSPNHAFDPADRTAVVEWVVEQLQATYVFPDVADRMAISLRTHLAEGVWTDHTDVVSFVQAVADDLEAVSGDRHIGLQYAPEPTMRAVRQDPAEEARRRDAQLSNLQYSNFMFQKVEYLDGNVGYLRFDRFYDPAWAGPTAIAALQFLAHTDALIIDLRQNGGGHAGMIRLLLSYFFDEPTHVNSWYDRQNDRTIQSWTADHVQGRRLADTELYVLTGRATFSAAEEFTYDLQALGRATVVGETTGGGGHTVRLVRHDELGVELRVPNSRAINPVTGTNWEGVGVVPDVATPATDALEAAHVLALQRLHEAAEPGSSRRAHLQWIAEYRGALHAPAPPEPAAVLQARAGTYGPVEVRFLDDRLFFVGPGSSEGKPLVRLRGTSYVIDGIADIRIEFEDDDGGRPTVLYGVFFNGRRDRFARNR